MSEKYKEMGSAADGMKTPSEALSESQPVWERLRNDATGETWVWCVLEGTVYRVVSSGSGDLSEMAAAALVRSDCIYFGGLRINKPAVKFIHVLYVPAGVSPLKRGKDQLQKAAIFNSWPGASKELSLTEMDETIFKEAVAKGVGCKVSDLS